MAKKKTSGKYIKCTGYEAFVPDPLPPEIVWTGQLIRSLSDADRLIGQLSGEGKQLPNPHLLIRPFIKREAVLSSRIEGTQATLGELLTIAAAINRLVHHSVILELNVSSYRAEEAQKRKIKDA